MFLGRAKDDDGNDRVFLESDAENVAQSLASGNPTEYFLIFLQANATVLKPVTLKPGPRQAAPASEFVEIVANGNIVGTARVDK